MLGLRPAVRIANCSGFYGDRFAAAREMVTGGPIDVLTGDYLAELTMLILAKARRRHGAGGFARTFLAQMEDVLGECLDRGIRIVTNAGGLAPHHLADALRAVSARLGLSCSVASVVGDDLLADLDRLREAGCPLANLDTAEPWSHLPGPALTANAYLGAWGITRALAAGADVVVCGRVTDASLVVGPASWWHQWPMDAWDALAGAVVAGHAIECGAQVTGGNYSSFLSLPALGHLGFPVAEVEADGSSVVTKHPGTGGAVTVGTVTAQLLYELQGPAYAGPDVTTRFDTVRLADAGPDRVRITGARGLPPPPDLKVAVNCEGGWRNAVTFALTGLDLDEKAELAVASLLAEVGGAACFDDVDIRRVRLAPENPGQASVTELVTVVVTDRDRERVGRAFSGAAIELALASYPGFFLTEPPRDATAVGVYWPTVVPAAEVRQIVEHGDGRVETIDRPPLTAPLPAVPPCTAPAPLAATTPTQVVAFGRIADCRSGDKGGNANVGVWVRSDEAWSWLRAALTVERFIELVPEAAGLTVQRHELPNLRALNFVVEGLLGRGVATTTRWDPQAKALGEWVRARPVDVPVAVVTAELAARANI